MKNHLLFKLTIALFLFTFLNHADAQKTYRFTAPITYSGTSGFYQLTLSPQIIARCNANLSDIRLLDENGKTVPYVLQKDLPTKYQRHFIAFESVPFTADSSTALLVKSQGNTVIQNLSLTIKNNSVKRIINLLGSDDLKKWYAISEDIPVNGAENPNKTYYEQLLSFPASSYQYYKISIANKNKTPIKIIKAGIYSDDKVSGKYQELPVPSISQKDSGAISFIKLKFNDVFEIDKITLKFFAPKFFKRDIELSKIVNGQQEPFTDPVSFSLNPATFQINQTAKELGITILNNDNAPLKLTQITAYQLSQSLSSYLEAGKKYHVEFGDSSAKQPQYDLRFFTDSITKSVSVAQIGNITANINPAKATVNKTKINYTYVMWAAIAIILLILGFFTYKLMNEVKAKGEA